MGQGMSLPSLSLFIATQLNRVVINVDQEYEYYDFTKKGGDIVYWLIKNRMIVTLVAVFALGTLLIAPNVKAQLDDPTFGLNTSGNFAIESGLGNQSLETTIGSIINVMLSLLGIIAVILILYGGFKWMTAGGNEENVGAAKKIIFSGIIGLVIILSAYAIASFVLRNLSVATGTGNLGE